MARFPRLQKLDLPGALPSRMLPLGLVVGSVVAFASPLLNLSPGTCRSNKDEGLAEWFLDPSGNFLVAVRGAVSTGPGVCLEGGIMDPEGRAHVPAYFQTQYQAGVGRSDVYLVDDAGEKSLVREDVPPSVGTWEVGGRYFWYKVVCAWVYDMVAQSGVGLWMAHAYELQSDS